MPTHPIDIAGQRFGGLVAASPDMVRRKGFWLCDCDCGNRISARGHDLRKGRYVSCGCVKKQRAATIVDVIHGHARAGGKVTSEYKSWRAMLARCENPDADGYDRYGGAGVTVCDHWHDFTAFLFDMGEKPEPKRAYSIDRFPNNRGNYEPGNCRWATRSQQQQNKGKGPR